MRNILVGRVSSRATKLLVELANTESGTNAWGRFRRLEQRYGLRPSGDEQDFRELQALVRKIWEGKRSGSEGAIVAMRLGLLPYGTSDEGEEVVAQQPPIKVNWKEGTLVPKFETLSDVVWITLLQQSRRLGVCENKGHGCLTPYFLKYRPKARFCSEPCALTAQRESKRKWWREHGEEWLAKRQAKKSGREKRRAK